MHKLTTRWRLAILFAPAAVLLALALGGTLSAPGTHAATALTKGVTCTEFYLDGDDDGVAEVVEANPLLPTADINGDTVINTQDISAIAISRIEPTQSGPAGSYDVTSALYLGPDTEADAETLTPNEAPDQGCLAARTEGTGSAEVSNLNSRTLLVNQFGARPAPARSTLNGVKTILTTRSCGFSESVSTWIRQDNFTTLTTSGPTSINNTDAVLYLAAGAPTSGTVAGEPNIASDPTTCAAAGSFPYTTVGKSYGRNIRTDAGTGGKNAGIAADLNIGAALDSADTVDDDYDGDGCTDWDELDKHFTHDYAAPASTGQLGMDPFNPNDCDSNFESNVSMALRITRVGGAPWVNDGRNTVNCSLAQVVVGNCVGNGYYIHCLGDVDHNKSAGDITLRTMCYPGTNFLKVNETAHGTAWCNQPPTLPDNRALCGDGKAGAPPPNIWPPAKLAKEAGAACSNRVDDDGDSSMNDGCPAIAFGGIDDAHLQATGTYAAGVMTFGGCFEGFGGAIFGPNVYAAGTIDTRTGAGTMDLWGVSDANLVADCINGPPASPAPVEAVIDFTELRNQKNAAGVLQPVTNKTFHRDSDRDYCTDSEELGGNRAVGGLRDPFNPYDYYDVVPPEGNGTINLFGDIFGVANKFGPSSGPLYDIEFDRGPKIPGANKWNLTGPDGTIDLFNDIFGVAFQFGNTC